MGMKERDRLDHMRGAVVLKIYRNGILEEEDSDHNLIVTAGRSKLAKLLGGGYTGAINRVGVGTGSTPAADGDKGLTNAVYIPISSTEYGEAKVRFNFVIGSSDANGMDIVELGLFFADGTIFSRRVRKSVIGKEDDLQITGYWEIYL
jgi:hypothetical protein|nr:hypothetical protein [Mitsuokella multacida]DAE59523.1 MAG TPA: tail collar fiber protein [Caudoviricetes sp.]